MNIGYTVNVTASVTDEQKAGLLKTFGYLPAEAAEMFGEFPDSIQAARIIGIEEQRQVSDILSTTAHLKRSQIRQMSTFKTVVGRIIKIAEWILAILFVINMLHMYVGRRAVINGSSMNPTLCDGQQTIMTYCSDRDTHPERFDIVIAYTDFNGGEYIVKRVIGLPGETVQIKNGNVWINGEQLDDPYGSVPMEEAGTFCLPHTLRSDEYFLLGDNRNDSEDSRFIDVGPIHQNDICGRVVWSLTPFRAIQTDYPAAL